MPSDAWAALANPFVEGAYASVKGQVRTYVLHAQLLRHLPEPPASVRDPYRQLSRVFQLIGRARGSGGR